MPGGRIATAIADHLRRTVVDTRVDMAGHHVNLVMEIQEAFFRLTGKELRDNAGPLLRELVDTGELDPNAARLLAFIGKGHGQFATMLGNQVVGAAVGTGLGLLLSNTLQPAVGRIVATQPHMPVSVSDAVRAAITGRTNGLDAHFEAAQQGIDRRKFDMLVDLGRPELTPDALLNAMHRGDISGAEVRGHLAAQGFRDWDITHLIATSTTIIDPPRLADAVTFGAISQDEATARAAHAGMTRADFDLLVRSNGMPPSNEELAYAYRRGVINHETFVRGLTQGPLRNEWIPLVEKMVLQPMSVADAVETVVKGHLSEDAGRAIALQNGLIPEHWQPLRDSAGSPPGVEAMLSFWKRGLMTEAEVDQGIRESRLMNKYIGVVKRAAERLPPERTIVSLVGKGALTHERGREQLLKLGFAPDIADALLIEAHKEKTTRQRELSGAQIVALYESRALTGPEALEMLGSVGYDDDTAQWELMLGDIRRRQKFIDAAISKVRSAYVAWRTDANTTSNVMDSLGVAPDQRDDLLDLWSLERAVGTKEFTVAQLVHLAKKGLIQADQLLGRLIAIGWTADDADLILTDAGLTIDQTGGRTP